MLFRVSVALALATLLTHCGTDTDDDPGGRSGSGLTVKFINSGEVPIAALHFQPAGDMPLNGWEALDWGDNTLPVASLQQLEFVLLPDFARADVDAMAEFERTSPLRWNVPAQWISDAEHLTVHAGRDTDGSWSSGHQFGLETYTGETDVTP